LGLADSASPGLYRAQFGPAARLREAWRVARWGVFVGALIYCLLVLSGHASFFATDQPIMMADAAGYYFPETPYARSDQPLGAANYRYSPAFLILIAPLRLLPELAVAAGATVLIIGVGVAVDPQLWIEWLQSLVAAPDTYEKNIGMAAPLWLRIAVAAAISVYAATSDRPWLLPVAVIVAMPGFSRLHSRSWSPRSFSTRELARRSSSRSSWRAANWSPFLWSKAL